jgi:thiamine pyrophosphate-dependent acetolactate synthase large subunit-like protein
MIKRHLATRALAQLASDETKLITCLGRISRDVYAFTDERSRQHCFFNTGSMGSVLPLALGIALGTPGKRILAVEGDGSVLMNMGALVTFKRYNPENLTLFIIDNGQYETTGGQPSQPPGFDLYSVCKSIGLNTTKAESPDELEGIIQRMTSFSATFQVVVIKALPDEVMPRIKEKPERLSQKFIKNLTRKSYAH